MRKQVLCAVILSGFTTLAAHAQNAVSGQVAVDYVPLSNYIRPEDSVKTGSKSDFRRIQFNGYNVDVDPCAGHIDPSIKAFFSPTDDLTILLLFS